MGCSAPIVESIDDGILNCPIFAPRYCWRMGQTTRAAKRDLRVRASGRPSNHAARRSRLSAAALAICCRCVFAGPR